MSAAKDQDWFCDGIAEEILNALAPLQGLRVAARTSAFSFKGKTDDLRMIGAKLNVTTVLAGSLRRAGDRLRITVQLSDVASGFQLWSDQYDRELKDIFDVQEEIAKAIAARLRVTLAGGKDARLVEQGTTNVEAYQLYLRGYALLARRGASIPEALDLFRKAVEIDPGYSHAWSGIADACTGLAITGSVSGSDGKSQAMAAATRSIEIDPTSAAGHTALACATLLFENNRGMAKEEFERALELRPSYALGRSWYATFFLQWACGELEQGIVEVRRALDGDPLSAYIMTLLACCLFTAGRLNEAIETCTPSCSTGSRVIYHAMGTRSVSWYRRTVRRGDLDARNGVGDLGTPLARARQPGLGLRAVREPASGERAARELVDRASRAYVPLTYLALPAEASGQHEEAMSLARRAWDGREPTFILHARHFPEFRSLRSDPRFVAILREMNRPTTGEASIAVLPFANMSADKENEYFGDGLAEEIINVLAHVPGMKVAGRTSSFFFRGKDVEFGEIGRRLNVEHILEGSVRKAGNRIRVTAQLIKVTDGFHLWSERYDREMTDIFAIQDEITQAIAAALRIKLSPEAASVGVIYPTFAPTRRTSRLEITGSRGRRNRWRRSRNCWSAPLSSIRNSGWRTASWVVTTRCKRTLASGRRARSSRWRWRQNKRRCAWIPRCLKPTPCWRCVSALRLRLERGGTALASGDGSRTRFTRVRFWYGNHYLLPIGRTEEAVEVMARGLQEDPLNLLYRHLCARSAARRQAG